MQITGIVERTVYPTPRREWPTPLLRSRSLLPAAIRDVPLVKGALAAMAVKKLRSFRSLAMTPALLHADFLCESASHAVRVLRSRLFRQNREIRDQQS